MRRIAVLVFAIACSLSLVEPGFAGPFGLSMGMKPADFIGLKKHTDPGSYTTTEVPKPHSAFEQYALLFSPRNGLCRIYAIGQTIQTSVYGSGLHSAFIQMEERLKAQYGKNKRHDMLGPGSVWNESKDFMMGLLTEERFLISFWLPQYDSTLKDNLGAVMLQAKALSNEKGYVIVNYEFQNLDKCQKELNAAEDDAL